MGIYQVKKRARASTQVELNFSTHSVYDYGLWIKNGCCCCYVFQITTFHTSKGGYERFKYTIFFSFIISISCVQRNKTVRE